MRPQNTALETDQTTLFGCAPAAQFEPMTICVILGRDMVDDGDLGSFVRRLVLVAAVLCAGTAVAEEGDRVPVLLRKSVLLTPIETAGTGLAPEVKVRVKLDDRGRVVEVETLGVTPSSEYDQLFLERTREEISYWRYAPAIRGGQAAAATLEWTVQFRARSLEDGGGETHRLWIPLPVSSSGGAEARRAQILALPLEQRKQLLSHQSRLAEKFVNREHRKRFDSPRFVVVSDTKDPKTAEITAGNLEAVFNIVQGLFGSQIEPQPEPLKIVVYMFTSQRSFDALKAELGWYEWSSGYYSPAGLFAFHLEQSSMDSLLGLMMHEATHAFVDRHLVQPGSYLPRWLGEGFAEYLGNSEIRKGRLIPGRTAKRKFVLVPGFGAVRRAPESRLSLEDVKRKIRRGDGLRVEQLMTADSGTFYGEKRELYYPSSWLLVHFLRHGEADWAEQEFSSFLLYVAEGYPAAAALETVYGVTPAELEDRFQQYVQKEF